MTSARRKQPDEVSPQDVCDALTATWSSLEPHYERVRADKNNLEVLIVVDWQKTTDKQALYEYRVLLRHLLLRNPSGIFKKLVVRKGLVDWEKNNSSMLSRVPNRLDTTAMAIVNLCQMLNACARNISTGARLPRWLQDLISLLDQEVAAPRAPGSSWQEEQTSIVPLRCTTRPACATEGASATDLETKDQRHQFGVGASG